MVYQNSTNPVIMFDLDPSWILMTLSGHRGYSYGSEVIIYFIRRNHDA